MGGALSTQGHVQGVYEKSANVNGIPTWTHTSSNKIIWLGSIGFWIIGPKTNNQDQDKGWLYNPVSGLPYGNGNEFFYFNGDEWVKPTNEIEVELECTPTGSGIRNHLYIT